MRMPRLRFREFLLVVTLISLVTAGFSINARTSNILFVQDHLSMAERARSQARSMDIQIANVKRQLEKPPKISRECALGHQFKLISKVTDPRDLPEAGQNLIVVTSLEGHPWFRIFDEKGKRVVDYVEWNREKSKDFVERIATLGPQHEFTNAEKLWIIDWIIVFVNDHQLWLHDYVKILETARSKALTEAEALEQSAR